MRITSLEAFHDYIKSGFQIGFKNLNFYRASKKHGLMVIEGISGQPIIGPSFHDVLRPYNEQALFFYYTTEDNNYLQHFSLLDANVIPNNYNDWYLFTTRKEAEEYIRPIDYAKNVHDRLATVIKDIELFENNIRPLARDQKIHCIKIIRTIVPMDLLEAKIYVEHLVNKYM